MAQPGRQSRIGFVGAGVVGTTLAVALARQGYRVVAAASRSLASAQALAARVPGCAALASAQQVADACDVVFITTPDDAIEAVAASVSWRPGQTAVHCSGAASLDVLASARRQGALVGAFHPVQTFSSVERALEALQGITFAIEGVPQVRPFLEELALALGGRPLALDSQARPLYHASTVMACGMVVALAAVAAELWQGFGVGRSEAIAALLPLMRETVANVGAVGPPAALTGPYARGDVGTVRKHLAALQSRAPEVLALYCQLALAGLPLALEKGRLTQERAVEIRELLKQAARDAAP